MGPRKLWERRGWECFTDPCSVLQEYTAQQKSVIRASVQAWSRDRKLGCWMNYLGGTWKSWREGSYGKETEMCSKVTCWGMRRGGIFESQRENCVWYLQQQHLLLNMLWDFVSSQDIVLLQLGEIEKDSLSPARPSLSWWNCSGGTKGCVLQRPHSSPLLTCLCSQKSGICRGHRALYPHTPDPKYVFWLLLGPAGPELRAWGHKGCEDTKYYSKIHTFARG